MSDIQIVPTILATDKKELQEQLAKVQKLENLINWVHFDFMDKKFVQNKSIDPDLLADQNLSQKKEAHLMVENPYEMLEGLNNLNFDRVIVHAESNEIKKTLKEINVLGMKAGLAVKNETSLEELIPYLMDIDLLLIMSVEPGFQGQSFIVESLEKIRQAYKLRGDNNLNFKIAVDGAIKDTNINLLVAAGVDQLEVGSFLFDGDINENFKNLRKAALG